MRSWLCFLRPSELDLGTSVGQAPSSPRVSSSATQAVLPWRAADAQDSSILTEHVPGDPQFSTLREQKLFKRYLTVFNRRVLFPATEDREVRHLAGDCYEYCGWGYGGSRLGLGHNPSMKRRSARLPRLPGRETHASQQSCLIASCAYAGCCS